jgi:hypothetical protein
MASVPIRWSAFSGQVSRYYRFKKIVTREANTIIIVKENEQKLQL